MINLNEIHKVTEGKRRKARNVQLGAGLIFILIFISFISSFSSMSMGSIFPFFIILAIALMIGTFVTRNFTKEYSEAVKSIISEKIFKPQFEAYQYNPERGFDYQTVKDLDLLPTGDSFMSNDLMSGTFHSIPFMRADVHTTSTTTDGEGHSTTVTHFKGQVYAFDFFKNSNSYIRIRDRSFSKFGRGRKVDGSKRITFDDSEFNDMFRTYANNDHEAFYLFTPHFMQMLKDFRTKLGLHYSLVIHDSKLYIAIYSNKDSFEPSVWRPIDQDYLNKVNQDINIIKTIIDDLDLKNTLFKEDSQ